MEFNTRMTRSELIHNLSLRFSDISEEKMERIVAVILDEIALSLVKGQRSEFRNFGSFSVRFRKGRMGRNPKTGQTITVESKNVPFFKYGKSLLIRLNQRNLENSSPLYETRSSSLHTKTPS